ncbi:MAG TPA: carboxypeptidase regulatory-like domain-containing protein, partial [Terriglobales bacterium]|nr:carboxypeptidase regulatory-like domain-containing protein [Terriglobales bacterium]
MRLKIALLMGALTLALVASAAAQEVTGNIRGVVKDQSGAIISGATVAITNTDRNQVVRTIKTGADGSYVAPLLPIGHYEVTVEAPGFDKFVQRGINLNVNDRLTIDVPMKVGTEQQQVTVEGEAPAIDLQTPTAAGLITGTQVRELAVNTRNYEQLVALTPGVSSGLSSDQLYVGVSNPVGTSNQVNFSIMGNRPTQNNWTIDGADNVDRGANLTLLNYPSIDSIAEFKVLRGSYNPEFGRSSSGEINVITRSGTNSFHGSAYEFFRNDVLAANNYFNNRNGLERPPLRYNDFGYTFGGPIWKNKTFFFWSQEFRRVITNTTFTSGEVPTSAERNGTFAAPVCLNTACTLTGTQVPAISPVAAGYVKDIFSKLPEPGADGTITFTGRNVFNYRQEAIRVDHNFSSKYSAFVRFTNDSIPTQEPGGLFTGSALPGVATTSTNSPGRSLSGRVTMTFSPTLLNELGYAYSYGAVLSTPIGTDALANAPDIRPQLPFANTLGRVPDLNFSNGEGVFGFGPYKDYNRNHAWFDNVSWIKGHHNFKFGGTFNWYQKQENAGRGNNGSYTFDSTDPSGNSTFQQEWANFLLGNVSNFTQNNIDFSADVRQKQFEAYAQDEWRLSPRFTLTYGVRYSYFMAPTDANGRATSFDPRLFNPALAPAIDPATGFLVPGTPTPVLNGVIIGGKNSPYGDAVNRTPKLNFAPRVGFALDPFGDGKTSIRSGFGIFYDSPAVNSLEQFQFSNPPFVNAVTINNTLLDTPGAVAPELNLAPSFLGGPMANWKQPYTMQWSFDIQHEITPTTTMDVGYYGSVGRHLIGVIDINEPRPGAAQAAGIVPPGTPITSSETQQLNLVRPFRGYDAINQFSPVFTSNYNSLQAALQKRFGGNSAVSLNYTWSKSLTTSWSDYTAVQNAYDLKAEYGPAQFDRTHVFTANYIYY